MDLSKKAKTRRDAVEEPLFCAAFEIERLDEVRKRIDAAIKVWPETQRTLSPALSTLDEMLGEFENLRKALSLLWHAGAEAKWKE